VSDDRIRRCHDERGASLILAIAFMLVIGGIGAAVVSSVTSGLNSRNVLDQVRNRQYAADAGVEYAVAQVRAKPLPGGPGLSPCGPAATPDHYNTALNGVSIRIDCANKSGLTTTGFLQRNVVFTACVVATTTPCGQPTTPIVVRAQINYQAVSAGTALNVTRTWVQSWSVNR
jgi:Tfp pilus assembly protein PilX